MTCMARYPSQTIEQNFVAKSICQQLLSKIVARLQTNAQWRTPQKASAFILELVEIGAVPFYEILEFRCCDTHITSAETKEESFSRVFQQYSSVDPPAPNLSKSGPHGPITGLQLFKKLATPLMTSKHSSLRGLRHFWIN